MSVLLDYFFKVTAIEPTPQASTSFLRQVLVLVKPKAGVTPGTLATITAASQIAAHTDNADAAQLFNGGLTRIYLLPVADLDIAAELEPHLSKFFTIAISSDFSDAEIAARDFGAFDGVTFLSGTDDEDLAQEAIIEKVVAMHTTAVTKARNLFFGIGKFLSATAWRNQQYIQMPFADDIDSVGEADALFDSKISFVLSDTQYGNRLALFAAGGKAIAAPYIKKNLIIDMQSAALAYISANQPAYTVREASLLEDQIQKVMDAYVAQGDIEVAVAVVTLRPGEGFTVDGDFRVSEPQALWRIEAEMRQA